MEFNKETFMEGLAVLLEKCVGSSEPRTELLGVDLAKSISEDERLFTAVVLRPEVVDAHGDIYSFDAVKNACHDYTAHCMNQNVQHLIDVEKQDIVVVESYIQKSNETLGDGQVFEGDWIMTAKIENDDIWKMCKEGTFTGFSVGCSSIAEDLT